MAYVILANREGEHLARQALDGPTLIGRSPQCTIRIHDIMLSREHCQLDEADGRWVVKDLHSRNGTYVNGKRVVRQDLADGDRLLVGHTQILFHEGVLTEGSLRQRMGAIERPADPREALSGTVVDFELETKFIPPIERPIARPMPRPIPQPKDGAESSVTASEAGGLDVQLPGASSSSWRSTRIQSASSEPSTTADMKTVSDPDVHQDGVWKKRTLVVVFQVVLTAAVIGAGIVGLVRLLSVKP